jgi:hypothetical protein
MFPRTDYPRLRFVVLPDLAAPDVQSAPMWVKHPRVTEAYNDARHVVLLQEVRRLFASSRTISMRDLHPRLIESLIKCA